MKRYYKQTRIPLSHGIVRRFVTYKRYENNDSNDYLRNLFAPLDRFYGFEEAIEDYALDELTGILKFMKKYKKHILTITR